MKRKAFRFKAPLGRICSDRYQRLWLLARKRNLLHTVCIVKRVVISISTLTIKDMICAKGGARVSVGRGTSGEREG